MTNKHKAKVLWESDAKTPAGDPFSTIKMARGYYTYLERGGKDSIAFILFDKNTEKFGLIYESKPPLDEALDEEVQLCTAFGGSIDMGANVTYKDICKTEVLEEAGYDVPLDSIHSIGSTLVSTQMSQMMEGFLVDVTDIEKTHKAEYETENSNEQDDKDPNEFNKNEVRWLDVNELLDNSDWKSIFIMTKAIFNDIIVK